MEQEKSEVQKLQEEIRLTQLRKELEELKAPAPSPQPIRLEKTEERKSKTEHHVKLNTSIAMEKALVAKILGTVPEIRDSDYTSTAVLIEFVVLGDDVSEVISDPASSRRPY